MNIPIITQKINFDKLIEALRTDIELLSWIAKTYPAVKKGIKNGLKTAEVYTNNGTYENILVSPDNSLKSFVFFEKRSGTIAKDDEIDSEYQVSLFCWYNLKAIDSTINYDYSETLLNDIVTILRTYKIGELTVNYNYDFADYNFLQKEKNQFVMYPFGAFRIDFSCRDIC
jgi:hypothetical protein